MCLNSLKVYLEKARQIAQRKRLLAHWRLLDVVVMFLFENLKSVRLTIPSLYGSPKIYKIEVCLPSFLSLTSQLRKPRLNGLWKYLNRYENKLLNTRFATTVSLQIISKNQTSTRLLHGHHILPLCLQTCG